MVDGNEVQIVEKAVAHSDYQGWLAWVEGNPIFEAVPMHSMPVITREGGVDLPYRAVGPRVMDWPDVPHMRIDRLVLFFLRQFYRADQQPVWDCYREAGSDVRLIQFKRRASVMSGGGVDLTPGRTGIMRYTLGTWLPSKSECRLWDIQPYPDEGDSMIQERPGPRRHPCWPNSSDPKVFDPLRHGFGLGPQVIGITESEIPQALEV